MEGGRKRGGVTGGAPVPLLRKPDSSGHLLTYRSACQHFTVVPKLNVKLPACYQMSPADILRAHVLSVNKLTVSLENPREYKLTLGCTNCNLVSKIKLWFNRQTVPVELVHKIQNKNIVFSAGFYNGFLQATQAESRTNNR